jgi:hypothetical protein
MAKRNRTNNDQQNFTQKTNDQATRGIPLNPSMNSDTLEGSWLAVPAPHVTPTHVP